MPSINIALFNRSSVLTDSQIKSVIPAFQTQISKHFAPFWGVDAGLTFVPQGTPVPGGHWWMGFYDDSDQAGALGYHDVTPQGRPLGKVFVKTTRSYGLNWTVTTSHELLEMLADPEIDLTVFAQNTQSSGVLWAYEVCDPCEAESFAYNIGNVKVSDFVTPAWFESFRPTGTKFDFGNHVKRPFDILSGGYMSIFNVQDGGSSWTQVNADKVIKRTRARHERRIKPRSLWKKSAVKGHG